MNISDELNIRIEEYVNDLMSAQDKVLFEQEMAQDTSLQKAVALEKRIKYKFSGKKIITTNMTQAIDGMKAITLKQQQAINQKKAKGKDKKGTKNSDVKNDIKNKNKKGEKQSNG